MIATNIATNIFAFILVLGVLIFAHEAGHFLVAKAFGVRVLVFSFGFGQRLFGFRRGDTDYRVSLIPLGGYVRMAGDTPEESRSGDPDEFLARPKWQRFLILFAGPFMNVLIAVAILAAINMVGTESLIERPILGEVMPGKPAAQSGLRVGDRIVAVNGNPIAGFDDLRMLISMSSGTPLRVDYVRDGIRHTTTMTPVAEQSEFGPVGRVGIGPWIDPIVGSVQQKSPAERAGIRPGDRIVAAGGQPISRWTQMNDIFDRAKGQPIPLDIARGVLRIRFVLPAVDRSAQTTYRGLFPPTHVRRLSLVPALADSLEENWKTVKYTAVSLKRILVHEGSVKELSGPITIARVSGSMLRQGFLPVVFLMAMISLQLGIMNLLPIPVLDGGHIMILLVEGAARRDLSLRVKERITQIGFAVLAALMIVVLYNDVITNVLLLRKG